MIVHCLVCVWVFKLFSVSVILGVYLLASNILLYCLSKITIFESFCVGCFEAVEWPVFPLCLYYLIYLVESGWSVTCDCFYQDVPVYLREFRFLGRGMCEP